VRVLLGIPSGGSPAKPFLDSLATLRLPAYVGSFDRYVVTGNFVPAQREMLLTRALETGVDVLVMCDDDMVLQPETVSALLEVMVRRPRAAIVGVLYYSRDGFRPLAVSSWNPNDTTSAHIPAFANEPVEVDGIGFGCVAIRLEAVGWISPPYFGAHVYMEPEHARVRVCDEDYLFCHRLRAKGWNVVLHAGARCKHHDRATGREQPERWEPPDQTSVARMPVLQDGRSMLVPLEALDPSGEIHVPVTVEYVWTKSE
jgi:hypothetical protein